MRKLTDVGKAWLTYIAIITLTAGYFIGKYKGYF